MMGQPLMMDIMLALIFLAAVIYGAKRGAFRALSGLLGAVLGFAAAYNYSSALQPAVRAVISPFVKMAVNSAAKSHGVADALDRMVTGELASAFERVAEALSLSPELYARVQQQAQQAGDTMLDALVEAVTQWLAPMIAFALIFIAVRVAVGLICRMLSVKGLPIVSTVNKLGGALLGAIYGVAAVVVICWAVLSFAPEEPQGFISRPVMRQSAVGGFVSSIVE